MRHVITQVSVIVDEGLEDHEENNQSKGNAMNIDELIQKLPEELQPIARRYASMFGANANKDDLFAIVMYYFAHQYRSAYKRIFNNLTNDEIAVIHKDANVRIKELVAEGNEDLNMPQFVATDFVTILIRLGVLALLG